jgi:TolB-like protein
VSFDGPPSARDVRAQLERILASSDFQGSQKRSALLRYLVEESLAGRGDLLKGFNVANSVFGRDVSFDAQNDAVVRLAVRRLRTAIDVYYGTTGSHDPLRISIPKGHYRAFFEWREERLADPGRISVEPGPEDLVPDRVVRKSAPHPLAVHSTNSIRTNRGTLVLLSCCIALAAGTWIWTMRSPDETQARGPAIMVLPFNALGAKADDRSVASGISQDLITELMRFPGLRLYSVPNGFPGVANADVAGLGNGPGDAYIVSGSVVSNNWMIRLSAQLTDARTGEIVWSETYDREMTSDTLLAARGDLAAHVAAVLGKPHGVVAKDMAGRLASGTNASLPSQGPVRGTRLAAGQGAQ